MTKTLPQTFVAWHKHFLALFTQGKADYNARVAAEYCSILQGNIQEDLKREFRYIDTMTLTKIMERCYKRKPIKEYTGIIGEAMNELINSRMKEETK